MKYDKMVERNRAVSMEKKDRAITAIRTLLSLNEPVTVSALSKKTGLSREYFYKNADVRNVLYEARKSQEVLVFDRPQKAILDKAMAEQLEAVKKQLEKEKENSRQLTEQNQKLQKALKKRDLNVLKKL